MAVAAVAAELRTHRIGDPARSPASRRLRLVSRLSPHYKHRGREKNRAMSGRRRKERLGRRQRKENQEMKVDLWMLFMGKKRAVIFVYFYHVSRGIHMIIIIILQTTTWGETRTE